MIQTVIARYATSAMANIIAIAALFLAGCASGWIIASNYYKVEISDLKRSQAEEIANKAEQERESLISYANRITEVQNEHTKNQRVINKLNAEHRRVHVNFPAAECEEDQHDSDSNVSSRALSESISDEFGELQRKNEELVIEADKLNIEAIRANGIIAAYAELCLQR